MNTRFRSLGPALPVPLVLGLVVACWAVTRPDAVRLAAPGSGSDYAPLDPPLEGVEIIRLRHDAKSRVVAQVMAGELDLFGAAAHFRQINLEPPEYPQLGYRLLPGKTDEEKLCREVIVWVKFRWPGRADHAEIVKTVTALENALASLASATPATSG